MKWIDAQVVDVFEDISAKVSRLDQKDFESTGPIPIVDQGEVFISGYSKKIELAFKENLPVIIFGDHTRALKFVDFPFIRGADGVKVLTSKELVPRFAYYLLSNVQMPSAGYSRHYKFLKESRITYPECKDEQKRIATILDKADRMRRLRRHARQLTESFIQLAFYSFFGDCKKFEKEPFDDLASPGRGSFVNGPFGSDLLTSELVATGVPVVYIRDIRDGRYTRVSEVCVTPTKAEQLDVCRVDPGDVLIAKVGDPPGVAAIYPAMEPPAIVTQDVIRIKPNLKKITPEFIATFLNSPIGYRTLLPIIVEGTRARFGLTPLKEILIPIPPLQEQQRFSSVYRKYENLYKKQIEAERQAEQLFQSLLYRAFTGALFVQQEALA